MYGSVLKVPFGRQVPSNAFPWRASRSSTELMDGCEALAFDWAPSVDLEGAAAQPPSTLVSSDRGPRSIGF